MTTTIKFIFKNVLVLFVAFGIVYTNAYANVNSFNLNKCSKGEKNLRVAVVQAGFFGDYGKVFRNMCFTLANDGYFNPINDIPLEFTAGDTYQNIAKISKNGCIELLEDGLYDGKWDENLILKTTNDLKDRIKNKKDVDLVWAFGTVAGKNFADSSLNVPVMVITPTDAESAGIIGLGEFSDKKNIHVQKEKNRYKSELLIFHDLFKFKNLGIVIDSDPKQQLSQAINIIEEVSKLKNFNIVSCMGPVFAEATDNKLDTLKRCSMELANKDIDAFYLPVGCETTDEFYSCIKPLIDKGIPTFSQLGDSQVAYGMLLSLSDSDMTEAGAFEAKVVEQIYNGKKPHEISQYYYAPLNLALNLQTAKTIGWKPNFEMLIAVDKIFQTIKTATNE